VPRAAFVDILDAAGVTLSQQTFAKIDSMRSSLRDQYGVTAPGVIFSQLTDILNEGNYRIIFLEREYAHGTINPGQKFVRLKTGEDSVFPPHGTWVVDTPQSPAEGELWGTVDYILYHLRTMLETRLAEFSATKKGAGAEGLPV
jgi:type III secretory pathway component EscV